MRHHLRLSLVLAALATGALAALPGAGAQEAQQSEEHQVTAVDFEFQPENITIKVGDTVNWVAAQANEEEHTIHEDDNTLFDGIIFPGQTFSYRFTSTGTFTYHCDIHTAENMVGSVIVEPLDTPIPPEAPTNVTAAAGDGSVTLSWSPPAFNGGSAVTGYTVTTNPGGATTTSTSTGATITGLTNGTAYTFEVAATTAAGTGPSATSPSVTPTGSGPSPSPSPDPGPDPDGLCPDAPAASFTDRESISPTHRTNVDCAAHLGVISGFADSTYRPTASVRRDQMASFIARSLEQAGVELPPPTTNRFTDVAPGSAHDDAIHRLAAANIVQGGAGGQPATTYGASQTVRRDQMASFLLRGAALAVAQDLESGTQAFADVGAGNPHFRNVNGAAQIGLTSGLADGSYGPGAGVRRDQMGTFVFRLLDYLHDSPS